LLSLSPASSTAADYCRQARRLRARFGNDPAKLQVALRELARAEDARPRAFVSNDPAFPFSGEAAPGPARLFSARVSEALGDGVLRYSARKQLLHEASQLGLGDFEATLLIAAVQHGERRGFHAATCNRAPRRSSSTPLTVLVAIVLQSVIAGTLWYVVHA
jgi:hypothetical protein